jgi:hypothetical protein
MINKKSVFLRMVVVALIISFSLSMTAYAETDSGLEDFVTRLYRLTLDREPDPDGLNYWVQELKQGSKTGADVSFHFIFSSEFLNKNLIASEFLDIMYRAFFDREPDGDGFKYWMDVMGKGYGRRYILAQFVNSKEFAGICSTYEIVPGEVKLSKADRTPDAGVLDTEEITRLYGPAVVYIEAFDSFGNLIGTGSGFVISADGKIMTNYHVIDGCTQATVHMEDGSYYDVEYVTGYDALRDIAVLKVDAINLFAVKLGDSDLVKTGQRVVAIGSPLGLFNTVSEGIVSSSSRSIGGENFIQTDAAVSPGSSGGALFNSRGEVIGVVSVELIDGQNLNFAIPINEVRHYADSDEQTALADLPLNYQEFYNMVTVFEWEPNNDQVMADIAGYSVYGEDIYEIFGTITGSRYDVDYYKFVVSVPGTITVFGDWLGEELQGSEKSLAFSIQDAKGNTWSSSTVIESGQECFCRVTHFVEPGIYYLVVHQTREGEDSYAGSQYGLVAAFKAAFDIPLEEQTLIEHIDGSIYIGNAVDGIPQGKGILILPNGTYFYGYFENGLMHGVGTLYLVDGGIYHGNWENGHVTGYGIYTWSDGDQYRGNWVDGVKSGYGVLETIDGEVYEGIWFNNELME